MEENKIFKTAKLIKPYIYDKENKCLRQLQIESEVYNLKEGKVELTWKEAETGNIINGDLSDYDVYPSKSDFVSGNRDTEACVELSLEEVIDKIAVCYTKRDSERKYVWVYENGQATKWYFDEHINVITVNYENGCLEDITTDVEIPEAYRSTEEVYKYNDYEVVNNDGTKEYHEGLYKRILLTDEQNKVVDKLQSMIAECKEAGIGIVFDYRSCELKVYNKASVGMYEYSPSEDDDHVLIETDFERSRRIEGIEDVNTDDDYWFVLDKNTIKTSK